MFIALFSLSTNKDYQTAKTLLLKDDWFFDSVFFQSKLSFWSFLQNLYEISVFVRAMLKHMQEKEFTVSNDVEQTFE